MQYTLHQRKDHIVMKNNIQPENRILTIPNLLSAFRLLLIPLFVWLYLQEKYFYTGLVLLISGITDISDGFIARRFHMVSNVGKVLDPVADKLTQISMLICLVTRYPLMLILVVIMIFKELFMKQKRCSARTGTARQRLFFSILPCSRMFFGFISL